MPIYEYECPLCNKVEEVLESLVDEPTLRMCECGGVTRRIISSGSFHLIGDGWYKPSASGSE